MSLDNYAKRELNMLLSGEDDGIQISINNHILEMIKLFANFGHSGSTAHYTINILNRLLRFKPLKPLTGEDDEWNQCDTKTWQNKRCSSVFKDENGVATDLDEFVISDDGGHSWFYSKIIPNTPITFPYNPPDKPKHIYIERFENGQFDIITDDPERIKKLYDKNKLKSEG